MKKTAWKNYLAWILFAEGVGLLSALLTMEGIRRYSELAYKPALTPPDWVFPLVWTILFGLMGISAARIAGKKAGAGRKRSLLLFFLQLGFNVLWSVLFFNLEAYGLAFLWLIALWALILLMILFFRSVDKWAAWLQIPYLLWVSFALWLNLGVWVLNG